MEYRTFEQFEEICEDAVNGNWKDAGRKFFQYGFNTYEFIKYLDDNGHLLEDKFDLAYLVESAHNYEMKMVRHAQDDIITNLRDSEKEYDLADPMLKIHWGLEEKFSLHEVDQIEALLERFSKFQEDNEHYNENDFDEFIRKEVIK